MHSYTRHLGDYAKDTRHLTLLEHGAYNVLMDWCYASERALPNDEAMLYRICAAFTKPEQLAVMSVLQQFFQEQPDGWIQKRIEQELMKAHEKRGKAKDAALTRWHADAMRTHSNGNADAMQTHSEGNTYAMPRGRALRNPVSLSLSLSIPPTPRQRGKSGKLTDPLFSDEVPEAYREPLSRWFCYKRELHKSYTPSGWEALVRQQLAYPAEIVARSVDASMASSWQGLFTDKVTNPMTSPMGFSPQKKEGGAVKSWAERRSEADQAQEDELATLPQLPRDDLPPEWDWQGVADLLYGASWESWSDVPEDARRELSAEWSKKEGGAQS
jgi:uncharacterized protein YdaU (DUF1376 family)